MVTTDVLAVQWWLEERRLVDVCHLVRMDAVFRSAGHS